MIASHATMRREIALQPAMLRSAIPELRQAAAGFSWPKPPGRIVFCGCGDSLTAAGLIAGPRRRTDERMLVVSAQEASSYLQLSRDDVVVTASVSGTTAATIAAAVAARQAGARCCAVTAAPASPLGREADHVVILPYRPVSRDTPHSLDFTMTVAALLAVKEAASGEALGLDRLPVLAERTLALPDADVEASAQPWSPTACLYVMGAGPGLATARYIVAKFHEAFGCSAIACELEDVAHGQHLAFRSGDMALLLALDPPAAARVAHLRPGLRQIGLRTVVIGGEGWSDIGIVADQGWPMQLAAAIIGQRLCLLAAERHGLPVTWPADAPQILAQRGWSAPTTRSDGA